MTTTTSVTETADTRETPSAEEVWVILLDLQQFFGLDWPEVIGVRHFGVLQIQLPDNQRAQVDRWASALGLPTCTVRTGLVFSHGTKGRWVQYKGSNVYGHSEQLPGWSIDLDCHVYLDVDASEHWRGSVAEPSTEEPDAELRHADGEVYDASVEDAHRCGKCGGGVFWWTAVGTPSRWRHTDQADSYRVDAHRPEVEHGYTHREGLGFLADDPGCQDCCDAARDAYAASVAEKVGGPFPGEEPRTERIEIGADGCGCPMTAEFKVAADGTVSPAWIDGSERTEHGEFCWDVTNPLAPKPTGGNPS